MCTYRMPIAATIRSSYSSKLVDCAVYTLYTHTYVCIVYLKSHVWHVFGEQEEAVHRREHGTAVARAQHRVDEIHDLESLVFVRNLVPANVNVNGNHTSEEKSFGDENETLFEKANAIIIVIIIMPPGWPRLII